MRISCVVALTFVFGCADGGRRGPDAGRPRDAGTRDAGAADIDARRPDAGSDAGADAGLDDAGEPRLDAGFDAGTDAGRIDAGCTTAAECSDGLACNGIERCVAGVCMPGVGPTCDDGIACTRDRCNEPAATCSFTPDTTLCRAGESCDAARGCVTMCSESPCRLTAPQCGCSAGLGCYIGAGGLRECRTAGTVADGSLCDGATSCRVGSDCINVSSSPTVPVSYCRPFCASDAGCSGGLCIIDLVDAAGAPIPGGTVCTTPCNPARMTGCPTGATCDVFQETAAPMRLFTDCRAPVGTRTQGLPCLDPSECASGYTCLDVDGPGIRGPECVHWCEVPSGRGCGPLEICLTFVTPIVIGGREYGVCD